MFFVGFLLECFWIWLALRAGDGCAQRPKQRDAGLCRRIFDASPGLQNSNRSAMTMVRLPLFDVIIP